jgi:hypothetical protein
VLELNRINSYFEDIKTSFYQMFAYLKANAQNMVLKNQTSFMSKESIFMSFSVNIIYPRIHPMKQSCRKVKPRILLSPKIRLIEKR